MAYLEYQILHSNEILHLFLTLPSHKISSNKDTITGCRISIIVFYSIREHDQETEETGTEQEQQTENEWSNHEQQRENDIRGQLFMSSTRQTVKWTKMRADQNSFIEHEQVGTETDLDWKAT